jgi:uncharacterized membrane protein
MIGHFHPLLVHLPIGILLLAFVLECMARWLGHAQLKPAIRMAILLGLGAAVLSALSGWMLAEEGGYEEALLEKHRWWGIGTLGLFGLLWVLKDSRWYFPLFSLAVLALTATGHFGGSLTHGSGYLFEAKTTENPAISTPTPVFSPETPIFKSIIQPILQEKCVSCHRPEKQKGKLLLTSEEGIAAGGKHGKIIVQGQPDSSNMLLRIRLPLHHDDHMPPSGKSQLSALEIKLLAWWIETGADFQALVKDKPLPPDLQQAILDAQAPPENPVFSLKISNASPQAIERLRSLHISVQALAPDKPWLSVSLAGQKSISAKHWSALESVADQLIALDLSHTDVNDKALASRNFPHLNRINLAHTAVSNAVLPFLEKSAYLESVNLTNTLVDNGLQAIFPKLKQLKTVYVWQTKTTADAMASWQKQYSKLQIESGASFDDGQTLTLRSPQLLYGRSFFDDTMQVELSFPFKGVDIYYTLAEAASPTTQSPKYKEKIVLDNTAHIRAFAAKEGWNNSPLVEAVFVKKKFSITKASLLRLPSPKYPAKGATSLIDGKIADAQGADTWLGFEGDHLEATLDLGDKRGINKLFVHCLENNSPWIFKPVAIEVWTSMDGKNYLQQGKERFAPNAAMGDQKVHLLGCHFPKEVQARFVRVKVESPLKNPSWHPGKGQKCWIFIDEITVE